jgi:hypothetical protein
VGGAAPAAAPTWPPRLSAEFSPDQACCTGLVIFAGIGTATSSAQEAINCSAAYKNSLEKLKQKELPPARLAALTRQALRIYDACKSDDIKQPKALFEALDRAKD